MMKTEAATLRTLRASYWQRTRRLTAFLLLTWFGATFCAVFFARELATLTLFGWPLSFYLAAQGISLLYLLILAIYALRMRRYDAQLRAATSTLEPPA
jgi:putative solute:sodium symporter small subunit